MGGSCANGAAVAGVQDVLLLFAGVSADRQAKRRVLEALVAV